MNPDTPGVEIERRFLVKSILRPEALEEYPSDKIIQGYLGGVPGKMMRVRIKNNDYASFTIKRGVGLRRTEYEIDSTNLAMGLAALESCSYTLSKTRHKINGWELDLFEGPLRGLVLLERELAFEDESLPSFPDFLDVGQEVTESINNLALAEASALLTEGADPARLLEMMSISASSVPMVVLTGGPGSGKSTSMRELQERYPQLAFVPEVATIVIAQVGIKPPIGDPVGIAKFQQLIYAVQRAFEHAAQDQAIRDGKKAIILDRGTLDNAAYVDGGLEGIERILRINAKTECDRYWGVICLSLPSQEIYDRIKANNPARSEDYETAKRLSNRIQSAWSLHTCCHIVPAGEDWQAVSDQVQDKLQRLIGEL